MLVTGGDSGQRRGGGKKNHVLAQAGGVSESCSGESVKVGDAVKVAVGESVMVGEGVRDGVVLGVKVRVRVGVGVSVRVGASVGGGVTVTNPADVVFGVPFFEATAVS